MAAKVSAVLLCAQRPRPRLINRKQVSKVKGTRRLSPGPRVRARGPFSPPDPVVVSYENFDEQIPDP